VQAIAFDLTGERLQGDRSLALSRGLATVSRLEVEGEGERALEVDRAPVFRRTLSSSWGRQHSPREPVTVREASSPSTRSADGAPSGTRWSASAITWDCQYNDLLLPGPVATYEQSALRVSQFRSWSAAGKLCAAQHA
jgi:hypothetical protein